MVSIAFFDITKKFAICITRCHKPSHGHYFMEIHIIGHMQTVLENMLVSILLHLEDMRESHYQSENFRS